MKFIKVMIRQVKRKITPILWPGGKVIWLGNPGHIFATHRGVAIMVKSRASIFAAAIFSLSFMAATSADAQMASQGFVRCGGNNFIGGPSNTENQITRWNLRNFNGVQPITVTRLIVYNAPGLVLYDSAVSGLPPFANGILGPANNVLGPHQSSTVFSENFLPFLSQQDRPVQFLLTWTSAAPALPLHVSSTTVVRERDPATGAQLAERSRDGGGCEETLRP